MPAARSFGPVPPAPWEPGLRRLVQASKSAIPGPSWWTDDLAFFAAFEVCVARTHYSWDGLKRPKEPPFFFFQFTLAGWGNFELHGEAPQRIGPGMGFFAVVPSRHRYYMPKESPGWTFGWVNIYHPYLIERASRQIAETGPVVRFGPTSTLFASVMRLVSGSFKKDFRDRFEVELAIFEFVIAYERLAYDMSHPSDERDRLLESVRRWVLVDPKRPLNVDSLAAEYGMSRSHFSHYFHVRTGLTPARVVAQVRIREAAKMLLESNASLKQIADACGFANANHFNRVFRRFQHVSPGEYRRLPP